MNQAIEKLSDERLIELGLSVIEMETAALRDLSASVDQNFVAACRLMLECKGRVVVLGMGKSGHIGGKIAATLASTGTPAFFVHPGEASHGDMGMITGQDVVLALSNSGETNEMLVLLPLIKRMGVPLISITGRASSTLATAASVNINVSVKIEACPLDLAPTSSTTAALAMGDALAVAMLKAKGFSAEDFAMAHPGGSLGKRLLLTVGDVMHVKREIPRVTEQVLLRDALVEMTSKGLGMTAVVDADEKVLGIFTDGDLRRALDQGVDVHTARIGEVMTRGGLTLKADRMAAEAVHLMDTRKINALLVVDDNNNLQGVLNMHDLLRAGVV